MKQTPLLLSTPMVQAVLQDRKTKTRRLKGLERVNENPDEYLFDQYYDGWYYFNNKIILIFDKQAKCPYGSVGDLLWVRETMIKNDGFTYWPVADGYTKNTPLDKTVPSIFMPKAACRIWLQITNIRVERLHSITLEDIKAEGVQVPVNGNKVLFTLGSDNSAIHFMPKTWSLVNSNNVTDYDYFFAYWAELWCKINGRANWDLNPWVWVIEFKRIERPV